MGEKCRRKSPSGLFFARFCPRNRGRNRRFCKGFAKGADFARATCGGEGKVGKRVFFAGFLFGLSPAVCTRVQQARQAGCAARWTMKGSWAKSRHVSRNSCALFQRSRVVLSPQTQQPHPRRQGEGGVGEMWPPRRCSGAGAQEGAGRHGAKGERHGATGTGRAIAVERGRRGSGAQEGAGTRSALVRATRRDQKRGPPPPGRPPRRPPGCTGRKLLPGRSPPGWPSGRSGSLAPPKMLRR